LLGRSSLPFARRQNRKMPCGSFDQALWPHAFVVSVQGCHLPFQSSVFRAFNLPFARRQNRKMPCGSFDQALWPHAFVVSVQACRLPGVTPVKCLAAASTRPSGRRHVLFERSSLPLASSVISF